MKIKIFDESIVGDIQNTIEIDVKELTTPEEIIKIRVANEVELYNNKVETIFKGLVEPRRKEISLNGIKKKKNVDLEQQIYIALDAFQKNGFFILIDDNQVSELNEPVVLTKKSEIKFIKLTPLVGG